MVYTPKTIKDIVFASDDSRDLIESIVDGSLPFPVSGKNGIILYGAYGTGKTALANLLPDAIEFNKCGNQANVTTEQIQQGNNGANIIGRLNKQAEFMPFSSHHYFVLDEIDNLTTDAMLSLKTVMNMPHTIFIMTTNNITKIEGGVRNRSYCIEFNAAPADKWLPLMRRILKDENVIIPADSVLLPVIARCEGSARDIVSAGLRLALKQRANG